MGSDPIFRSAAGRVLLVDGATGTELRRRGVELDPVAWSGPASLSHAQLLEDIHADYLRAGAEVVTTNTFGTNRFVLTAAGYGDRFETVNRAAFDAACRARDAVRPTAAIAGSISCLPPGFDTMRYPDPETESAAYLELAALLADLGVDLLVLEMMEDVEHASRACEAARQVGLPFWIGVSARFDHEGRRLVAYDFPETPLADVLDALLPVAPAAVNVMHTPIDAVAAALDEVGAKWHGYRGAYPEIGDASARAAREASPDGLAELALKWTAAGARILGGCCGTTPAHIAALRRVLDSGAHVK
ncbi:MAG TPA: homocysteine S-methyltransferase family protein [Gammaproteobacteria bacterium]|nr:homocysteine S-methyltransferase family protein [Gammaproteobacteria bacterium]